jgi:hypothetical protein
MGFSKKLREVFECNKPVGLGTWLRTRKSFLSSHFPDLTFSHISESDSRGTGTLPNTTRYLAVR